MRAPVGFCDRGHDGQSETGPPLERDPRSVGTVKTLEEPGWVLWRYARSVVLHLTNGEIALAGHPYRGRRPGGVWARTLPRRLSSTCRRRARSPRTSTGSWASRRTGHSGATVDAASTASAASPTSSSGFFSRGRPSSIRASRSRSSTRWLMRDVSIRMPDMTRPRSSGRRSAPRSNSSA